MGTVQDWQGPGPINGSRYLMCLRSDSLRYVIERLALPGILLEKKDPKCEYSRMYASILFSSLHGLQLMTFILYPLEVSCNNFYG